MKAFKITINRGYKPSKKREHVSHWAVCASCGKDIFTNQTNYDIEVTEDGIAAVDFFIDVCSKKCAQVYILAHMGE